MSNPIEIFLWATPNSWKVTIALEEMDIPYVAKPVAIGKGEQFRPDFLAISPNNRVPAILDPEGPDGAPVSIFESGAILQYLGRKSGMFYPRTERERLEVDQWLFWQMAGVGPMFGQASHFLIYAPNLVEESGKLDYSIQRYSREVDRLLGVLDQRLDGRTHVAGSYSIADMAIYPWITMVNYLGQDFGKFPRLAAWVDRLGARPAVQRGMAVGSDLGRTPPPRGTSEAKEFASALFGQTAASVAAATARHR
jgi:GSH-dependent disulfide-bond oxidoreductase